VVIVVVAIVVVGEVVRKQLPGAPAHGLVQ